MFSTKYSGLASLAVTCIATLVACTTTTPTAGPQTGAGPGAGRNVAGGAGASAGITPTAIPSNTIAPVAIIAVDGVLALGSPLVTASFDTSGKIIAVNARPGMTVKMGDVLATLDGSALSLTLQLAQEKLVLQQVQIANSLAPATGSDLDTARAGLASAYASYNMARQGSTTQDIDSALRSWNQAKNSLYSSQLSRDSVCATNTGGKCVVAELSVKSSELGEQSAHDKYILAQQPPTADKLTQSWSSVVQSQAALAKLIANTSDEQKHIYDLQIAQANLAVERARRNFSKLKLLSPCDCRVQSVTLVPGGNETGSITLLQPTQLK